MKRTPLSLIRLYKLAQGYVHKHSTEHTKSDTEVAYKIVTEYLKYINDHKNDLL